MKKIITLFTVIALFCNAEMDAQLSGPKTIPGNYSTIAAAITDLNSVGVGDGGVTFNVAPGHTETFAGPTAGTITTTGTSANQMSSINLTIYVSRTVLQPIAKAEAGRLHRL